MTQIYLRDGKAFHPADPDSMNVQEKLPMGTYTVVVTPKGYHLELIEDFTLPSKIYGDTERTAERILNTYFSRPFSTGVLLSGEKGTGKTMLTACIARKARDLGAVTIVINNQLCGEGFNAFIQGIDQPAVILFDEFEKVYDRDHQQALLTIFDGTYQTNKLFLLTCNESHRVDSYMINRPGRIFYNIEFRGLSPEFIREYCEDNLHNKGDIGGVLTVASFFGSFSFDMLKALVEEMNRYSESATDSMKLLNMKPIIFNDGYRYECSIVGPDGTEFKGYSHLDDPFISRSPMTFPDGWHACMNARQIDEEKGETHNPGEITEDIYMPLMKDNLISLDAEKGIFIFKTKFPEYNVRFERKSAGPSHFDYDRF